MLRNICPVSSDVFTFENDKNRMVAEASDIGWKNIFDQLFDDAYDIGLAIRSERTKKVVYFHVAEEIKDQEGDILVWILKPISQHAKPNTKLYNLEVHVLND